ncbi:hypothetical protein AL542_10940 [Grimontia hollisae]|uniref:Uncharacterized protein n=2 Tax=Grimontia hollisae TaxID=673 RepID=D0I3C7_GRIHO|nr:hypothetical protein [Grimontia hollisae]AMG30827.1 hypothetical protein AL542_10940 [Grimontia hollisae]EEY73948.1 hypothetical protein VHA_000240 [Grimontia hollisae CIP 101886]MDF2186424.1 hypothetical protein [Grimontia hollisae]STO47318.1 Uncharacterised protein [Grimontia hollisae]STO56268.1 Uncharacterised protein [Grimontia hollisae]
MEAFMIPRLDTEVGLVRVEGTWDPLTGDIQLVDIDQMGTDGWVDVTFWLSEQEHEARVAEILIAAKLYLVTQ